MNNHGNHQNSDNRMRPGFLVLLACAVTGIFLLIWVYQSKRSATSKTEAPAAEEQAMPAKKPAVMKPMAVSRPSTLEEAWGIQISSLRLSMADTMMDLRYKLLDPVKAVSLADGKNQAYLLDQASGVKVVMPNPSKEGGFPPTSQKLTVGKTYFTMVANPGGGFKRGSKVTLVIGGFQAANLTVE